MRRYKWLLVALALLSVLALVACAPNANPSEGQGPDPAGFWTGLWQGFTVVFTFIWSLFNDKVSIYEVANNGGWYDFGFVLGASMFFGGSGGGACAGRKR